MKKLIIGIVVAAVVIGVGYLVIGRGMQVRASNAGEAAPTAFRAEGYSGKADGRRRCG